MALPDTAAIEGYFVKELRTLDEPTVALDLNGDGDMIDMAVPTWLYRLQKNPVGNQLIERRANYPSLTICAP